MAEQQIPIADFSTYTFDPSHPIPSDRESRNHVMERGPIRPMQDTFPVDKRGRKFLTAWYKKHNWLEYSTSTDKAFCFYCRIFNKQISQKGDPAFISDGFGNWKKSENFSKHEKSACHRFSLESFTVWKKQRPIDYQMSEDAATRESYRQEKVSKNRSIIGKLFDITRLLGKLNLAFRGHRENEESTNKGLFREFVEYVSQTDVLLKDHLLNSPANATYLSPGIQNQLIALVGSSIKKEIITRVRNAGVYSIIADETPDTSKKEQLSLIVRYVNNGVVEERLLAIKVVNETDARTLLKTVTEELEECEIPVSNVRGQCYDGASNVSGIHAGLQALMREFSPTALYIHCYAHVLNLVIVDSMTNNSVAKDFFGTLQNLYVFIENCTKRHAIFVKHQEQLNASKDVEKTMVYFLKKLSDTRWACRADSIKAIYYTIESVIATLNEVQKVEKKPSIYTEAKGLLRSIDFEFILALEVLKPIWYLSKGASDKLQAKDLDVVTGCERVAELLEAIKEFRNDDKYESFWQKARLKCSEIGIEEPPEERIRKIPKKFDENQHTAVRLDVKNKLKINFYYNVLDLMATSISTRFNRQSLSILKGLGYLSPHRLASPEAVKHITSAVEWYKNDIDFDALEGQVLLLQKSQALQRVLERAKKEKRAAMLIEIYNEIKDDVVCYDAVRKLMQIALTLPLTSCSAERTFSKLKLIKTRLRSTMAQERLQSLMLMSVEQDILTKLDTKLLIEEFVNAAPRKMNLV